MTQHDLYGLEVGAGLQMVCGEAVAEGMRGDLLDQAGLARGPGADPLHGASGQGPPGIDRREKPVSRPVEAPVAAQLVKQCLRERDIAILGTFALVHTHEHPGTVNVGKLKRKDLERFVSTADESCQIMESNLHRASDLIKSFKQVAVDQAHDSYREFGLKDYVEETLISLRPNFKNKPIDLAIEIDGDLVMDSNPGAV